VTKSRNRPKREPRKPKTMGEQLAPLVEQPKHVEGPPPPTEEELEVIAMIYGPRRAAVSRVIADNDELLARLDDEDAA
jgi:hypothetical protein